MDAPDLTIKAEPAEASSVVYGALAAKTANDPSNGQLSLVLTITNNEPSPVHLNFAYDLLVRAFNASSNSWPTSAPGADVTKNESYHIWGKRVYAMADGVVKQFMDGVAANTPPVAPSPAPKPVEGNHFYIQHGDDLALYAHFQAGTLNLALTSGPNSDGTGATVTKGQVLGLVGNSGNSSQPHLHIQVNRATTPWGGPPRPLPFDDIYVLALSAVPDTWPPDQDAPWNAVSAQALPNVTSAIWPGRLRPGKSTLLRWAEPLAWAWIIIVGGLMITPGGVSCHACGRGLTNMLGIVSMTLGVLGFVSRAIAGRAAARQHFGPPRIDEKGDMHS